MLTIFCLNKLQLITLIVLISSCLQVTQQKPVTQNFISFNPFNQFDHYTRFHQYSKEQQQLPQNLVSDNSRSLPEFQNQNIDGSSQQFQRPYRENFIQSSNLNNQKWLNPGQELIFATTTAAPTTTAVVFVNNQPAVPTMVPFIPVATTPTPQFLDCFSRCPTTSEFNPICASNRQQYGNEQKFNCAQRCGADIQIVRRGSCQGLFPMSRG